MRLPFLAAALALGLAAAPLPAQASALPPLGLERGHGTVGIGFVHLAGDVAVADGVTVGLDAYGNVFLFNAASARASVTTWQGPGGSLGFLAAAGTGVGYAGPAVPFLQLTPMYESPPWWVRLRASLGTGFFARGYERLGDGTERLMSNYPVTDVVVARGTKYELGLQPVLEVVIPVGQHVELTLLGNSLASIYARW